MMARTQLLRADLAHAIFERVIEYRQPIRSAITVAGMVGHSANNSRSWFSTASASLTRGPRSRREPDQRATRPDRVPSNPQPAGDLFNRHALGPMQPADLRPILH
jgi:hypothetical protein